MMITIERVKLIEALTKRLEEEEARYAKEVDQYEAALEKHNEQLRALLTKIVNDSAQVLQLSLLTHFSKGPCIEVHIPGKLPEGLTERPSKPARKRVTVRGSRWEQESLTESLKRSIAQLEVASEEIMKLKDNDPMLMHLR